MTKTRKEVMLIIVCGLQGAGKTTVAKEVAEKLKAVLLRTDIIRKSLIKEPKYTVAEMQKIYKEMFIRARKMLQDDKNVVLDATFTKKENRMEAKKIAEETNVDFQIIEVVCSEKVIKKRIEQRSGDDSEANFEVYLKYKNLFEPITEKHIVIDNSGTLRDLDEQLNRYF